MYSIGRWVKTQGLNGIGILALFAIGCSDLASGKDTAAVNPEPAGDPKWACLGSRVPFAPLSPSPMYAVYAVPIFDFGKPPSAVPGVEVRPCRIRDFECPPEAAVGQVQPTMDADVPGTSLKIKVYPIVMPYGVDSYLRLTAPPGYLTTEYFLGGPLLGTREGTTTAEGWPLIKTDLPVPLVSIQGANGLATEVAAERDPTKAIIALRTLDCLGQPSAGVRLSLSSSIDGGVPFTFLTGQAVLTTDEDATDERGTAGFANVSLPPGAPYQNVTVEGIAPTGEPYGRIVVTIRPNQLSYASIRPDNGLYGR